MMLMEKGETAEQQKTNRNTVEYETDFRSVASLPSYSMFC